MTEQSKKFLSLKEVSLPWPWIFTILVAIGVILATVKANSVLAKSAYDKACSVELAVAGISPQVERILEVVEEKWGK